MGFWDTAKKVGKSVVEYEKDEIRKKLNEIQKYRDRYERYDSEELKKIAMRSSTPPFAKMAIKQILVDRGEM